MSMSLFEMGGGLFIESHNRVWECVRKRPGSYNSGPHTRTFPSF